MDQEDLEYALTGIGGGLIAFSQIYQGDMDTTRDFFVDFATGDDRSEVYRNYGVDENQIREGVSYVEKSVKHFLG